MALKAHCEGKGIYANNIASAKSDIDNIFYIGENRPNMSWTEFEWLHTRMNTGCESC